jgi:glucokinase
MEMGRRLLGIEIGGTKLQLGCGTGDGTILALERRRVDPSAGAEGIRQQIIEAWSALVARVRAEPSDLSSVGVGFGGPVDSTTGRVITSHQIAGWDDFPLADWLCEALPAPRVVLQNDADTAGLAEARFGAGIGFSPLLYVTIGSGIGGGLIVDGTIYRGGGRGAIEVGHLRVPAGDTTRALEDVASGWAIASSARVRANRLTEEERENSTVLRLAEGVPERITTEIAAEAARSGDPDAIATLSQAIRALAFALNQAVTLLAPRRIVLGGGVSLIGDALWFTPIRQCVDGGVFPPFRGTFEIVPAALGEVVVVQGALALAHDAALAS